VQRALGHASITTTAKYAHSDTEDIRRAMEETSRKLHVDKPESGKALKNKA